MEPWNGVDYTEFTEAHKKKIRAHYAGLVKQIDYEMGQILDALREKELLDNTIIIFSSDHGDYLGDHDFIGKGTFFESSIHVPLLVRLPWTDQSQTCGDIVELGDVTATMLHFGGCEVPDYMDSIPLPELDIPHKNRRERVIGMVRGGWMIYDGQWKLCKYASGEVLLFNLSEDPNEQHNLMKDGRYQEEYIRLDGELTREIMNSMSLSHESKRVYAKTTLAGDPAFGKEDWQRSYPKNINDGD